MKVATFIICMTTERQLNGFIRSEAAAIRSVNTFKCDLAL